MHKENSETEDIVSLRKRAKFFDVLSSHFYKCNFGTCSKSEIDLLMFHFYCELHRDQTKEIDSYTLSKTLGITQDRVRNLKVKEYLSFPKKIDWQKTFIEDLEDKIRYNENNKSVEIPVLDPNVFIEIEHTIEELHGYVRYMRNGKILSISLLDFSNLLIHLDAEAKLDAKRKAKRLIEKNYDEMKSLAPSQIKELVLEKCCGVAIPLLSQVFSKIFLPN